MRISQYADDTVLFLENSSACLQGALQELGTFSAASGLRLNIEKTSCMQIGQPNRQHSEDSRGIKWVSQLKILGIHFTDDNSNLTRALLGLWIFYHLLGGVEHPPSISAPAHRRTKQKTAFESSRKIISKSFRSYFGSGQN